jgi:TRAP-type C4-dicarboxylate transport system permease small subunit
MISESAAVAVDMKTSFRIVLHWCELVLVTFAALACAGMMLLTSADALSRYMFNSPILGAYELTEKYLMVAAIFLGMSYAYRGGAFIRVTFLVDRLPRAAKIAADYFAYAVSLACCLIFLLATGQQAWRALGDSATLTTLPLPIGPSYLFVPLGFLAMTILLLRDLPRVREGRALLFAHDTPTASS